MDQQAFIASLTTEQNAALLAFRDSLLAMYNQTAIDNASSYSANLANKQAEVDQLSATLSEKDQQIWSLNNQLSSASQVAQELTAESLSLQSQVSQLQSALNAKQAELDAALARIDELENPRSVAWQIAPNDFVKRFTPEALIAVQMSTDPIVILGRTDIQTIITYIDLKDPQTSMYVGRLVQLGIITEQQAAQILSY